MPPLEAGDWNGWRWLQFGVPYLIIGAVSGMLWKNGNHASAVAVFVCGYVARSLAYNLLAI
jgi:hypothetical protein